MSLSRSDLEPALTFERPFADNAAHVRAEIDWLHELVRSRIVATAEAQDSNVDEFAGLYISRDEIDRYLTEEHGPTDDDDAGAHPTSEAQTDMWSHRAALDRRVRLSVACGVDLRLDRLARAFDLDATARTALLCVVAPDFDARISRVFAYLQNDATRKRPGFALLVRLLTGRRTDPETLRRLFGPSSALMAGRLLDMNGDMAGAPLPTREAAPAVGVIDFLLGIDALPTSIASAVDIVAAPRTLEGLAYHRHHAVILDELLRCRKAAGRLPLTYLSGPGGSGRSLIIEALAAHLGRPLLRVQWSRLRAASIGIEESGRLINREATLRDSLVLIEGVDEAIGEADSDKAKATSLQTLAHALTGSEVLATGAAAPADVRHRLAVRVLAFEVRYPTASERVEIWARTLPPGIASQVNGEIATIADKFHFTPGQIVHALQVAALAAPRDAQDEPIVTARALQARCRDEAQRGLHLYCEQIVPRFEWDDIVLPADTRVQLQEICYWVKHGAQVYDAWGFGVKLAATKGVTVLFSGPSGTGKTMSAEVIANDLQLDLFRVDLSRVVSKYIGETEKNLSRIFEQSAASNCILFFDEADSLFGKRTEVKDAHDRYANIEVNYLLAQMDRYQGLIIVATNLKGNLDSAFIRRFSHVVEYPVPNERLRQEIWRKAFPASTPLAADVDFAFLAQRLDLSGANIKNIALTSAFLASADQRNVDMEHVIRATRREYQKIGRICSKSEFGQYYGLVREADAS
jgi:SpoVK/Ycf46/Vps4 family AAA+-type ATPase